MLCSVLVGTQKAAAAAADLVVITPRAHAASTSRLTPYIPPVDEDVVEKEETDEAFHARTSAARKRNSAQLINKTPIKGGRRYYRTGKVSKRR